MTQTQKSYSSHPKPVFSMPEHIRASWCDIRVRSAEKSDGKVIAWALQESARSHLGRGLWDALFPGDEEKRLRILESLTTSDTHHFCHYRDFFIAENLNGEFLGAMASYRPDISGPEEFSVFFLNFLKSLDYSDSEIFKCVMDVAPFFKIIPPAPSRSLVAEWAASAPKYRHKGLTFLLTEYLIQSARAKNLKLIQISHFCGNHPVERSLLRAGFKFIQTCENHRFKDKMGTEGMKSYRFFL